MANSERSAAMFLTLFLASTLAISFASGEIVCEKLPNNKCSFAISSSGMRCVLEKYVRDTKAREQCRTSHVKVHDMSGWIEADRCIEACNLNRSWTGISSDSLLDLTFVERLCSAACYQNCPNIANLYFNLAAAEGVLLPKLCEALNSDSRRSMLDAISSGFIISEDTAPASKPTPKPKRH